MDLKNFFVCTVILEFVKEFNVNNTDYEVMNIWKYIHKSSNRGFLFATAEVVYIINCDDLPSCNPNTDSCLPRTWIVLAFPKVSPGFSGFDEYTQDVPRSIAWSGAHWLWFSFHDMIGGSYICVSRAWFSVICQIKRTIMRLGKYNWYCVNKGECFLFLFKAYHCMIVSFIEFCGFISFLSKVLLVLLSFYCFS